MQRERTFFFPRASSAATSAGGDKLSQDSVKTNLPPSVSETGVVWTPREEDETSAFSLHQPPPSSSSSSFLFALYDWSQGDGEPAEPPSPLAALHCSRDEAATYRAEVQMRTERVRVCVCISVREDRREREREAVPMCWKRERKSPRERERDSYWVKKCGEGEKSGNVKIKMCEKSKYVERGNCVCTSTGVFARSCAKRK